MILKTMLELLRTQQTDWGRDGWNDIQNHIRLRPVERRVYKNGMGQIFAHVHVTPISCFFVVADEFSLAKRLYIRLWLFSLDKHRVDTYPTTLHQPINVMRLVSWYTFTLNGLCLARLRYVTMIQTKSEHCRCNVLILMYHINTWLELHITIEIEKEE